MKKLAPWILFLACVLLLGLGATPFGPSADLVFIGSRFSVLILLSILILRRVVRGRHHAGDALNKDRGDELLRSFTRWCQGENRHI